MKLHKIFAALAAGALLSVGLPVYAEEESSSYDGMSADGTFGYYLLDDGSISVYCEDTGVSSVTVPDAIDGHTVTRLEEGCFSECMKLSELVLPASVNSIGKGAFYDCERLTEFTVKEGVILDNYAFDGASGLTAIHVDAGHSSYQSIDGVLFDKSGTTLIKYPEARPDTSYTVPASCHTLGDWSFIGSKNLQTIDISSVKTIGADVFYFCVALKSITVPEGITVLPSNTFGCCIALESVQLPSTLTEIGENCFFSCTKLKSVTLPDGLERILSYAFAHCTSLTELTVPKSVVTVTTACMGYAYDDTTASYKQQAGFVLHLHEGSPVETYASSNKIPYDYVKEQSFALYYVLIGVVAAVIAVLVVAIVKTVRKPK